MKTGEGMTQQAFRLGDIRPNPFRNIDRYPISRIKVDGLKKSIGRTSFWDNMVARITPDGKPEIGYGHHRMVALRELYPDDHKIKLIVRDLDDAAMLHTMADENMQEWASTGAVIVETVRAVRDFLVVSVPARKRQGRNGEKPGSAEDITAFLGWPERRVEDALAIIRSEEAGDIQPEDTAGLDMEQATVMRRHVTKIADPVVKAKAIARVRDDLREGRIGKRGIPDVVHQVRVESEPTRVKPQVPISVALGIYRDIDQFFALTVSINGRKMTRGDVIREVAANRDAVELQGLSGPMADQLADALRELAKQAERFAIELRAEERQLAAGGVR